MSHLKTAVWLATSACNLRCKHCYNSSAFQKKDELSTEEVKRLIIDELSKLKAESLTISGGEPLLRPDIIEIIKYAKSKNLKVHLLSNGTLLNEENVNQLKKYVDTVQISIEGLKNKHESIRGKGTFDKTIKGIKMLVKNKIYTILSNTPIGYDKNNLKDVINLAKKLKVQEITFRKFVALGRAKQNYQKEASNKEKIDFLETLMTYRKKEKSLKIGSGDPFFCFSYFLLQGSDKKIIDTSNMLGGCGAGIAAIAIDSGGNIMPCTRLPYNLGNIKQTMLSNVWIKSKELKRLRDRSRLKGRCGKCKLKNLCGGCRAKAYLNNKDMFGEDPECFLSTYKRITAYKLMKEGEVSLKKGKLKQGKEKMERGISILSETQVTDLDMLFIGLGYEKIRDFEKALLIYKALIRKIKAKDISLEYALKAMISRALGRKNKNKELFLNAKALFEKASKHSHLFKEKWLIAAKECGKLGEKHG